MNWQRCLIPINQPSLLDLGAVHLDIANMTLGPVLLGHVFITHVTHTNAIECKRRG